MKVRVLRRLEVEMAGFKDPFIIQEGEEFEVQRKLEGAWSTQYWVQVRSYAGLIPLQPDEVEEVV